jgi:hypothetical protein
VRREVEFAAGDGTALRRRLYVPEGVKSVTCWASHDARLLSAAVLVRELHALACNSLTRTIRGRYCTTSAVTIPNMPCSRSTWFRMT